MKLGAKVWRLSIPEKLKVVEIIKAHPGKTAQELLPAVVAMMGKPVTANTVKGVAKDWGLTLKPASPNGGPLQVALDKIAALEARVARLESEWGVK